MAGSIVASGGHQPPGRRGCHFEQRTAPRRAANLCSAVLLVTALLVLQPNCGFAQTYPTRPIRLVVAQAPGGQNDIVARILAQPLGEALQQPAVVKNLGGVGGTIGADAVAKAPADDYTLLIGGSNNLAIAAALFKNLLYDPLKDCVPTRAIAQVPYAPAANAQVPAGTLSDLVACARANPGRLTCASGGNGSASGLAAELFKSMASIDMLQVPHRGSAPAATPPSVVAKLEAVLASVHRSDGVRRRLLQQGYEPIDEASPWLGAAIRSDIVKYAAIIESTGIKAEP